MKLRLPDIIGAGSDSKTVLENLIAALVQESSVRTRRPAEVTISGLATLPRIASMANALPNMSDQSQYLYQENIEKEAFFSAQQIFEKTRVSSNENLQRASLLLTKKSPPRRASPRKHKSRMSAETHAIVQKQLDALTGDKFSKAKVSAENWIPQIVRHKSVEREIQVVKETTKDYHMLQVIQERQMKDILTSDIEKARNERRLLNFLKIERNKEIHDTPCGLCQVEFLSVNLPLKVSHRAIIDFRIMSKGDLNSFTVFGKKPPLAIEDGKESAGDSDDGSRKQDVLDKSDRIRINHAKRYGVVPRCYDEVSVCLFCSQFFQQPEEYRPPFQKIYNDERDARERERKRIEEEYWDPLKMSEKFREAEEKDLLAKQMREAEEAARILEEERERSSMSSVVLDGAVGANTTGPQAADAGLDANNSEFDVVGN